MTTHNSIIGLGTAAIGRPQYINIRQETQKDILLEDFKKQGYQALEHAYKKGIRYFDTAPGYGLAEKLVAEWLETKNDPSIVIATKWGYTYTANFDPNAIQHEIKEHSLSKLNQQWENSKSLLPNLKIYQIHSATFETSVLSNEAVLNQLDQLKEAHHLEIGITTSGENQIEVIKKALDIEINQRPLFTAFQVTYNILDQSLLEISKLIKNKKVIIKEALANGRLFPNKRYPHYESLYRTLAILAQKYNVGIDAIALRFCNDTILPYKTLSGGAIPQHIDDNLKATSFTLTNEDIESLKAHQKETKSYWNERKQLAWN